MRKAQLAGQIFIYIIAVVVVGLIILYGYSAIKSFSKRGEEVEYLTLKTSLESAVKGISSDFGSIKRPDIAIPGKYKQVCFGEKVSGAVINATQWCMKEPIACAVWRTNRSNVFLIPDGTDNFDVGEIATLPQGEHVICFDVVNNKINLQL